MIELIIIAILQGLFEWLPISSSGQVMIISLNLFDVSPDVAFSLSIWLHLGTTFAVIVKFRKDYFNIAKTILPKWSISDDNSIKKRNWLIIGTIGTAITALPLYFLFQLIILGGFTSSQGDILTLIISGLLIITGIFLLRIKKIYGTKEIQNTTGKETIKNSLLAGLSQGFAILPGVSRSGFTVSTILLEKYTQENALKLSFLMSVPVALASIVVDILFGGGYMLSVLDPLTIIIVTIVSFIVGYLSMEILIRISKKVQFGYFCILYGIIAWLVIFPVSLITA
ncbi:MAG: undecaprenyl-diphosphate phosphatase [Candidatus Heimdallarchaeota archaeon]